VQNALRDASPKPYNKPDDKENDYDASEDTKAVCRYSATAVSMWVKERIHIEVLGRNGDICKSDVHTEKDDQKHEIEERVWVCTSKQDLHQGED
jgi:hypothetical protein